MNSFLRRFFLNEHCINIAIVLNITTIVIEEYGISHPLLSAVDYATILFFVFEMGFKHADLGFRGYWKNGWNRLDGVLVILSLPTLCELFLQNGLIGNASIVLSLRIFRVFRFFRLTHFFPNVNAIATNFRRALKEARAVLIAALVIMSIFALISCSLFKEDAPQFFRNPGISFYSIFRLFTVEGWYEIPDAVAANYVGVSATLIRLFFSFVLVLGGIICMSLINSIFVDAMVSDNNDDLIKDMHRIEKKMDAILREKGIDPEHFDK